jgi:TrmH family RNA methyltransferase
MISSTANPRIKQVRALQTKRLTRQRESAFVVEGVRWAREVVAADLPVHLVLHTDHLDARGRGLANSMARLGAEVRVVSDQVMEACTDTQSPPGILVVLPIPDPGVPERLTLALVIDGLADPGNMGTLLRTALAAGVQAAFCTPGTVDPYNPKVLRGAMGAHLHLPIIPLQAREVPDRLGGLSIWLAEAHSGQPYTTVDWRPPAALVIGGEAHGPSDPIRRIASGSVHIPIAAGVESLNAAIAAAVILFEVVRQREPQ